MIKIRLNRRGVKNKPFYRIVAIDSKKKRGGEALAILGYWNPKKNEIKVKKDEVKKWIEKGAKMSQAVNSLLNK